MGHSARHVGDLKLCPSVNKCREAVGIEISLMAVADLDVEGDGGCDDSTEYDELPDDGDSADIASDNGMHSEDDDGEPVVFVGGIIQHPVRDRKPPFLRLEIRGMCRLMTKYFLSLHSFCEPFCALL